MFREGEDGPRYEIGPFDPIRHDRSGFACGIERIDNFLLRTARKHQEGDFTRVFVATRSGEAAILGYYAINAHKLSGDNLPDVLTRRGPRHGVPAAYLSMIGVSASGQGSGLGTLLLADALRRILSASDSIGVKAVVLDVIDDGGEAAARRRAAFYLRMGFQPFPGQPSRMFISISDVRAAFAE